MDASNMKKRMGRLSRDFHRRMDNDPRLASISAALDSVVKTLGDIKRDFIVAESQAREVVEPIVEAPSTPAKKPASRPRKKKSS